MASMISASGVTSEYWNGANENPLRIAPGETKEITFTLQNMVGDDTLSFRAQVVNGTSIATLVDANPIYTVPPQTKDVQVKLVIKLPANAVLNQRYNVGVSFTSITNAEAGQFRIGSAFEKYFDVIPTISAAVQAPEKTSKTMYLLILGIIIVLMIIWYLRKKQ